MKLSNYIAEFIAAKGTRHVFTVTGGAIAHVVDAIGRRMEREQDISYVCVEHEQAGAMAAEAYSRLGPGPGVAIATSGPGATNLITGICGLYFDSLPGVFITGQVNTKESVESTQSKPRQVGFQETDIVRIVTPVTKYAVQVRDPSRIRYELEKAYYIAHERRQGPVLLDVPLDVQVAEIETEKLERFKPQESDALPEEEIRANVRETLALLKAAARPVILLGGGVKLAHAQALAKETVEALGIPAVVSWSGFDILPHDHPQFAGAIGVYGNRGANFTIQNSDFFLSVGSRLDTRQTGGRVDWFAREAKSVMVDIDESELHKGRGFAPTVAVRADAKAFLRVLLQEIRRDEVPARHEWLARAIAWRRKYPAVLPEYYAQPSISSYAFVRALSDAVGPNEIVITNEGGNLVWTMQAWEVKEGQRVISTFGNSPMGYAFPAAIGAAFARPGKQIIC
ncbi:MAG: thiamine pyrophosphate-binding protein, partial [Candidatus Liptonbacteria bacterium]|nr:thiamine pyrophosphate-binding protein [Candidatus Liptonbacteria bacterium]